MSPAPDIFLSYNREDADVARLYANAFETAGLNVWWDATLRSGEAYDQVTEDALKSAKAVVVLWSKKSVASRWVRAEATLAERNRTLVPARIEPCDLPIMFELTQTADLSNWNGESADPVWRGFLEDVCRLVGGRVELKPKGGTTPMSSRPQTAGARASIALLPFINRTGFTEDDIFADCMVEDLAAVLSGNPRMKVIAASATAGYRDSARDVRQIGNDLAVRYLLEGNVRRVGSTLRVTTQLIEAKDGDILWTHRFDRPLMELAQLQEDLVVELAAQLGIQVEGLEIEHALRNLESLSSWDAQWRAYEYSSHGSRKSLEAAVADLKRAVEAHPDDAFALAGLASYQGQLWHYRGGGDADFAQEIERNVRQARALAPHNPEVLLCAGLALAWIRRPHEALPLIERGTALKPNFHIAHLSLGMILAMLGRTDEAIAELDRADRHAPVSRVRDLSWRWRSVAHFQAGRYQDALEAAIQAQRVLPGTESLVQQALCHAMLGDRARALEVVRQLRSKPVALVEGLIQGLYSGSARTDEFIAVLHDLWDETGGKT